MATTMDVIEDRARVLAGARAELGALVQALNAGLEAMKAEQMPDIREAIDLATAAWGRLEQAIQAAPELFVKPRTVAAHGITFGIQKSKGAIEIPDPDKTVALIRKHLPDQARVLISVKEVPVKKAVEKLAAAELKRIGVHVGEAVDAVVIRPAPSDVDKLVRALVKAQVEDEPATD